MIIKVDVPFEKQDQFIESVQNLGFKVQELDEGNYFDTCPECGDFEFWSHGICSHCAYSH